MSEFTPDLKGKTTNLKGYFFTGNLLIPRNGRTKFVKPVLLALTCLTPNVFSLAEII